MSEGEFKKRLLDFAEALDTEFGAMWTKDGKQHTHMDELQEIVEEAKKEIEDILSADMPDFQKLLVISAFKNKWLGEKKNE